MVGHSERVKVLGATVYELQKSTAIQTRARKEIVNRKAHPSLNRAAGGLFPSNSNHLSIIDTCVYPTSMLVRLYGRGLLCPLHSDQRLLSISNIPHDPSSNMHSRDLLKLFFPVLFVKYF